MEALAVTQASDFHSRVWSYYSVINIEAKEEARKKKEALAREAEARKEKEAQLAREPKLEKKKKHNWLEKLKLKKKKIWEKH